MEVLLGMALLTLAFLAVAGVFSRQLQMVTRAKEMTEAAEIGQRLLDEIRKDDRTLPSTAMTFQPSTPPLPGPPQFPPPPFPSLVGGMGNYQISVKVEPGSVPDVILVEVLVSWADGRGVTLQTCFPN